MAFRILLLCFILFIFELYVFQALKTITKVRWVLIVYFFISFSAIVFIGYQFTKFDRSVGQTKMTMITLGLLLLVLIPKLILTLVLFFEDIYRVLSGTISKISERVIAEDFTLTNISSLSTQALLLISLTSIT